MKTTARIQQAKSGELWLFVDAPDKPITADDSSTFIQDTLGVREPGGAAYAILPEEVEAIRDACNEYLDSKGDSL